MEKTERFGLVLTPQELAAVTSLAELEGGLSKAALIRRLVRDAAMDRGLWAGEHSLSKGILQSEDNGGEG